MTTRFERDTGIEPIGDGVYTGRIDRGWWIVRGPNGGYVAAIALRAMTDAADDPSRGVRSFTIHYTRPPVEGPVRVETTIEKQGRSLTTVTARMTQDDKLVALAIGALSRPWEGPAFSDLRMPEVAPPEDIEPRTDRFGMGFRERFDFRWAIGDRAPSEDREAVSGAWMRLRDRQVADHIVVAQLMDAWAPAVFAKIPPPSGGVPTIDMTVHFREPLPLEGATPEDWYLGVFRTTTARDGFIEEDGELWSRDGRLVAQSRQLALLFGA